MNPLLLDLVLYLQSLSLVKGDGIDAFRDFAPDKPDDILVLNEYMGDRVPPQMQELSHRSIQVLYRSIDADKSRNEAWKMYNAFKTEDEAARIDFTEERWGQVYLRQTPFKIKADEAQRVYFGFNMGITTQTE